MGVACCGHTYRHMSTHTAIPSDSLTSNTPSDARFPSNKAGPHGQAHEDVPTKGKMCPWWPMKGKLRPGRGRCAHEGEDVPMKAHEGKLCPGRGRCAHEGEDVPMKAHEGKLCPGRGRCAHEGDLRQKFKKWRGPRGCGIHYIKMMKWAFG